MRIWLIFGGRSVEHLVSLRSARTIAEALREAGHEVVPAGIDPEGRFCSPSSSRLALEGGHALRSEHPTALASLDELRQAEVDVAFPIVHGTFGEDGALQGLLEMVGLPYVGAGVEASAVAMDKARTKQVLVAAGLPVVDGLVVTAARFADDRDGVFDAVASLGFPAFVKPTVGGSSVGCRRIEDAAAFDEALSFALRFHSAVLVERCVVAKELEVALLGDETLAASCVGEIAPGAAFYDYADKYLNDVAGLYAPARIDDELARVLREAAVTAGEALGIEGLARVDFFYVEDDGRWYLNEINTLPGFTDISMYPRLWAESGKSRAVLVDELVRLALARAERRGRIDAETRAFVAEQERASVPPKAT